jgi:glycosyltransferase involved in cell wall biosynthesis
MTTVLAITIADPETGSTKYRVSQYRDLLSAHGMHLDLVHRRAPTRQLKAALARADIVINQKCLLSPWIGRHVWQRTDRVLFDFDDAIYTRPGRPYGALTGLRVRWGLRYWLRRARVTVVANEYLARYARQYSRRVEVIPMGLDLSVWRPAEPRIDDRVVIGWAGAPVNLPLVEGLAPVLGELRRRHPNVEFRIYCGRPPQGDLPFEHVPYAPGTEPEFVRGLDIGLLPLVDEEHSRGKSPIKSVQYLACGIPVVGNVMGATAEICTPENSIAVGHGANEWLAALSRLVEDRELRRRLGTVGRAHVSANFSAATNGLRLAELLVELASLPA